MMNILILIPFLITIPISAINRKLGYIAEAISSVIFLTYSIFNSNQITTPFIIISSIVWLLTSVFSIEYDKYGKWLSPLYATTILGMVIILQSTNYIEFLAGWEIMTIPAYIAIGLVRKEPRPAFIFMAFGELSTALLLAAFVIASIEGITYTYLSSPLPLILATFGFMIKMGITPFMISEWLPIAHGTAPSNLSSILSATMTLMGVYGIVRITYLTLNIPLPFSLLIIGIGAFSVFFGALYAYVNESIKGILAFSTIENNGAILTAIGIYMFSKQMGFQSIETISLYTIIIYAFAHSIAKAGLFLSSGLQESQSISFTEKIRDKAYTLGLILLTSSMAGLLPNLGGIASWLLLENLFMTSFALHSLLSSIFIVAGFIIAMGEGFATALLVRYISYLSLFRNNINRIKNILSIPILLSGIIIITLGITLPYFIYPYKTSIPQYGMLFNSVIITQYDNNVFGGISPLYVFILIAAFSTITYITFGKPKIRKSKIWNNGVNDQEEYTAFAISNNIRLMLRKLLKPEGEIYIPSYGLDVFWEYMYKIAKSLRTFGRKFGRTLINSSILWYITYIIIILIITLLIIIS